MQLLHYPYVARKVLSESLYFVTSYTTARENGSCSDLENTGFGDVSEKIFLCYSYVMIVWKQILTMMVLVVTT